MEAVVKVDCVHTEPNYSLPWQRKRQFTSTSTGFIIQGRREGERWLLTNAHSVDYHTQVHPRGTDSITKHACQSLCVPCCACDCHNPAGIPPACCTKMTHCSLSPALMCSVSGAVCCFLVLANKRVAPDCGTWLGAYMAGCCC